MRGQSSFFVGWRFLLGLLCKPLDQNQKPKEIEKTKQEVSNVFKSNGLKITIDANKKIVNFPDATFDLAHGSYKPYTKPNTYTDRAITHQHC